MLKLLTFIFHLVHRSKIKMYVLFTSQCIKLLFRLVCYNHVWKRFHNIHLLHQSECLQLTLMSTGSKLVQPAIIILTWGEWSLASSLDGIWLPCPEPFPSARLGKGSGSRWGQTPLPPWSSWTAPEASSQIWLSVVLALGLAFSQLTSELGRLQINKDSWEKNTIREQRSRYRDGRYLSGWTWWTGWLCSACVSVWQLWPQVTQLCSFS